MSNRQTKKQAAEEHNRRYEEARLRADRPRHRTERTPSWLGLTAALSEVMLIVPTTRSEDK